MLPKIEHPIYDIYLKSLDKSVKFRPFLVKEEKLLLMAKESKEPKAVVDTIRQIIRNCLLEETINTDSLPTFDIEMLFVKLRAKSVGESVKLSFTCHNVLDGNQVCGGETDYSIDLEKVKYEESAEHESKIMLNDTMGFKLKYPTLNQNVNFVVDENDIEALLVMLMNSIEYVFDKESVYKTENIPQNELKDFLDNLTIESLDRIQKFFATMPKVVLEDVVTCKKCGYEHTIRTENLLDFFM